MYDGATQLLVENPINRYLINSPMLPELKKNADGSLTLLVQKDEPTDPVQKANWLPAPNGPIYISATYVLAEGIGAQWQLAATWYPGCEVIVQISTSAVLSFD